MKVYLAYLPAAGKCDTLLAVLQVFASGINTSTLYDCTDIAAFAIGDLDFETVDNKCTGPGQGYFVNTPATVPGIAVPPTNTFYCTKFILDGDTVRRHACSIQVDPASCD